MIETIREHPAAVGGIVVLLIAIVVYFLKKVDNKIDNHASLINTMQAELKIQLATMRADLKEDIVEAFNDTCTERQGSCARLQQAKLDTIQATHTAICAKLARLDQERREAWSEQRRWNDKVETTIYADRRNGGK